MQLLVAGGAVIVAAGGAALSALLGGGSSAPKAKAVPAARALEALAADEACVLIDIRSKPEIKATGGPNLKGVSKRGAVSVPFVVVVQVRRRWPEVESPTSQQPRPGPRLWLIRRPSLNSWRALPARVPGTG